MERAKRMIEIPKLEKQFEEQIQNDHLFHEQADRDWGRDSYRGRDRDGYKDRDPYRERDQYRERDRDSGYCAKYRDRDRNLYQDEDRYRDQGRDRDMGSWRRSPHSTEQGTDQERERDYFQRRDDRQESRGGDWRGSDACDSPARRPRQADQGREREDDGWERVQRRR